MHTVASPDTRDTLQQLLADAQASLPADLAQAESLAQQAQQLAIQLTDSPSHAQALFLLGAVDYYRAEYGQALEHVEDALHLTNPLPESLIKIRLRNLKAIIYRQLGDFCTAAKLYEESLAMAKAIDDTVSTVNTLNGLASLQSNLGYYQSALDYLAQAMQIAESTGNAYQQAMLNGNMCHEYTHLGQHEEALRHGNLCVQMLETLNKSHEGLFAMISIAEAYEALGQYEKAKTCLEKIIRIARDQQQLQNASSALEKLGRLMLTHYQDPAAAIAYAQQSLESLTTENRMSAYVAYELLGKAYAQQGQWQLAYEAMVTYAAYHKRLFTQENAKTLKKMEIRYKTEQALQRAELHELRAKELERQRAQDRDYFEQIAAIKDDFIRSASHDLKNPLSRISLNTDLLRRSGIVRDPVGERYLRSIEQAGETILALVIDLLELLRVEGRRTLTLGTYQVCEMLTDIQEIFSEQARARNITITADCVENVQATYDDFLMRRALDNLVSNAIKYNRVGGHITLKATRGENNALILTVSDTGEGILPQDLPHVFDRFYRSKQHHESAIEGSGVGLAIVKSIIESHHGHITVESQVGQGTRFEIIIPPLALLG